MTIYLEYLESHFTFRPSIRSHTVQAYVQGNSEIGLFLFNIKGFFWGVYFRRNFVSEGILRLIVFER